MSKSNKLQDAALAIGALLLLCSATILSALEITKG